jgi:hypothetical protein
MFSSFTTPTYRESLLSCERMAVVMLGRPIIELPRRRLAGTTRNRTTRTMSLSIERIRLRVDFAREEEPRPNLMRSTDRRRSVLHRRHTGLRRESETGHSLDNESARSPRARGSHAPSRRAQACYPRRAARRWTAIPPKAPELWVSRKTAISMKFSRSQTLSGQGPFTSARIVSDGILSIRLFICRVFPGENSALRPS